MAVYLVCAELFKPLAITGGPLETGHRASKGRFYEQAFGVYRNPRNPATKRTMTTAPTSQMMLFTTGFLSQIYGAAL